MDLFCLKDIIGMTDEILIFNNLKMSKLSFIILTSDFIVVFLVC